MGPREVDNLIPESIASCITTIQDIVHGYCTSTNIIRDLGANIGLPCDCVSWLYPVRAICRRQILDLNDLVHEFYIFSLIPRPNVFARRWNSMYYITLRWRHRAIAQ